MERTVLNSLGFRVNTATAYSFWSLYRLGHAMHNPTASLASYLMVRRGAPLPGRRLPSSNACIACVTALAPGRQAPALQLLAGSPLGASH